MAPARRTFRGGGAMANERNTGERLAATVGERVEQDAREGDTAGVERAQAVVEDLREAGWNEGGAEGEGAGAEERETSRGPAGRGRRSGIGWAVAAGVGAWIVAGMVERAFRR